MLLGRHNDKEIPRVRLNGKVYRLCDVYKYFPVSDNTVRSRYKKGLRGAELIHGKGVFKAVYKL
ncbi:hypothetical protein E2557_08365 [Staphylococcus petrasii]|uniref:Phage protein n=1 Tax=Staphylococcus petrasii TaxID=1276936 RepID=A0ABY2KSD7_9STAP|nr:hypothetical protein CD137_03260 [Staphylococcus petrasii]TGE11780.1 hypothetical protein E2557_08365 [Staphylococcus petrasii]TGE15127.1 hypothetical protein BJR09_12085 [Staphylococcus petrasii]